MNNLQQRVLEELVYSKVKEALDNKELNIPTALFEALDCSEDELNDAVMELLENGAYVQPDEMSLSVDSIDVMLEFALERNLTLTFGFGSVLETFVIDQISFIIDCDLIEWM